MDAPRRSHEWACPHTDGEYQAGDARQDRGAYDYVDEAGKVLFQVVRFDPKVFRQRRPDGRGGWVWCVKDCRPVLYRLPELIEAVAKGQPVFIVEGEKDADNLAKLGLPATTNPMGVGKWRGEYNEIAARRRRRHHPDNDEAGREHVAEVATALHGIAARVRVLDLARHWAECPAKGDISDWLVAGGTAEKLKALVEALPTGKTTTAEHGTAPSVANVASVAWPVMNDAAYYGLAGEVVRTIEPHSEADPVALLLQFLTLAGNVIGRSPYYQVEADDHHANLFACPGRRKRQGPQGHSDGARSRGREGG